jgi:hypothetical protein
MAAGTDETVAGSASRLHWTLVLLGSLSCSLPVLPPASSTPIRQGSDLLEPGRCDRIVRIEVRRVDRELVTFCEDGTRFYFSAAFGRDSTGPKRRVDDLRTPEGKYQIAGEPRPSRFHLFIPINYPSPRDAELGLEAGRISVRTYEEIVRSSAEGVLPPQHTPLGGRIGFHGEGKEWRGQSLYHDWTNGCIALRDDQIEFLARRVFVGTPVRIGP